jgi:hypothetical protein
MKFRDSVLKASVGVLDFVWYCFLPIGRSGGVVVGVNSSTVNIKDITRGDRCVKFNIQNKSDGFEWCMVAVYSAARDAQKAGFLAELVRICDDTTLPMSVGVILV